MKAAYGGVSILLALVKKTIVFFLIKEAADGGANLFFEDKAVVFCMVKETMMVKVFF
jgi:hypothetical protein